MHDPLGDALVIAHQRHLGEAPRRGLGQREGIGRVRVARSRRGQDLLRRRDHARLRVPGPLVGELRRERAVDLSRFEAPDQEGRDHAPVLTLRQDARIGGPSQHDFLVDADDLVQRAGPSEQHAVDLRFPFAEPGAGARADVAAAIAVRAVLGRPLVEVKGTVRPVGPARVVVAENMERAHHHAGRATGAQSRDDDLVVEISPLGFLGAVPSGSHGGQYRGGNPESREGSTCWFRGPPSYRLRPG